MRPQEAMQVLDTLVIANRIHEETNVQSFLRLVEIYKSRAEKAEAKIKELETGTYCAYCGKRFELDDSAAVLIGEHIAKCEKHPMRGLDREILRLQRLLDWAMKPEDQKKLQQQFDDLDEKERIKKEFKERESEE